MAENSKIEWTDSTWQILTGCSIESPGCNNCYAMRLAGTRLRDHPSRAGLTHVVNGNIVWTGEVRFNEQWLVQPLRWKRPRNIFVVAHGDIAHEAVPDDWLARIFNVMVECPQHRFQVLTKRPERLADLLDGPKPHDRWHRQLWHRSTLPNVWIGTSVERQQEADLRREHLERLAACGWNTWISYEPALGSVDWGGWEFARWMVSGGESGPDARPSQPDWHRAARDWCQVNSIPYFFKQWGEWKPELRRGCLRAMQRVGKKAAGALLDGREWREFPARPSAPRR